MSAIIFPINTKINTLHNFPILHYGETEVLTIIKLAKNNGATEEEIHDIRTKFFIF